MTFKETYDCLVSYANKMNLSTYWKVVLSRHAFYYYEKALKSMGYYLNDDAVRNMNELFEQTCITYQRYYYENIFNDDFSAEKEKNRLFNAVRVLWFLSEVEKSIIHKNYASPIIAKPLNK